MANLVRCSLVLYTILVISCKFSFGSYEANSNPLIQQELDRVSQLPGQNFETSFQHYSGYITINKDSGKNLFYWFFEAVEDPDSKPLILWLNGGPGCSSIAFGEAEEIGPFRVTKDGKSVYFNRYSWNQAANVIFLDTPVGVGFSYSNTSSDYENVGDKSTAADNLAFILEWLQRFPQYKGREFYLTGESYAGHFIPQLSRAIIRHNKVAKKNIINFKGFLLGNALIDDHYDQKGIFQFMWTLGMISDESFELLNRNCLNEPYLNASKECGDAHNNAANEIGNVDYYSIFTPPCTTSSNTLNRFFKRWQAGLLSENYDPCTEQHSLVYFNLPEVQQSLHVYNAPRKWETCSNDVHYSWKDSARSLLSTINELTHHGLRIWIFSGDTDAVIPVTSTRFSLRALKLPKIGPWRPWSQDGQVRGWTQDYEGLTFVTVQGGGHEVALHKPKRALTIFKSFLSGTSLPTFKPFSDS